MKGPAPGNDTRITARQGRVTWGAGEPVPASSRNPGRAARAALLLPILWSAPALARDVRALQRAMDGVWNGGGMALHIDTERLQANLDPDRPFEWKTFRIVDVTGDFAVFDIGANRFIGRLSDDASAMTLTASGGAGERLLQHLRR